MADTKEIILEKLVALRRQAAKLAVQRFSAVDVNGRVGLVFATSGNQTALMDVVSQAAGDSLAAALNAALDAYIAGAKLADAETALADEYKSAKGAEEVVVEEEVVES